jgi:hypothetical protein
MFFAELDSLMCFLTTVWVHFLVNFLLSEVLMPGREGMSQEIFVFVAVEAENGLVDTW